jgi:hypothetical protein
MARTENGSIRVVVYAQLDESERVEIPAPTNRGNPNRRALMDSVRLEVSHYWNGVNVSFAGMGRIILASGHVSSRRLGTYVDVDAGDVPAEVCRLMLLEAKRRAGMVDEVLRAEIEAG